MGVSASIDFYFEHKISPLVFFETLINAGWSINDGGYISYLPIGDDDNLDWTRCDLSKWDDIKAIIKQKTVNKEIIGLVLTWKESNIGGEVLIWEDAMGAAFCLTVNRQQQSDNPRKTNFSWYLDRISTALASAGMQPIKITCEQSF